MSLEKEIKDVLNDFEHTSPGKILEILNQIKPQFKNKLISDYSRFPDGYCPFLQNIVNCQIKHAMF